MSEKTYKAAIIGVGRGGEGKAGIHSIGYAHADAYQANGRIALTAACDLDEENLSRFRHTYAVEGSTELADMLEKVRPELVSICTYAGTHLPILRACAEAGVRGIYCEKPLCLTMDEGREMSALAERHGIFVVVNHYRRYLHLFREARRIVQAGEIGQPVFFSSSLAGWDLMEWGTHWLDMFRFLANDQPVQWVMGQARCRGEKHQYGHYMEDHSLALLGFADGSRALLEGGQAHNGEAAVRVVGTDGLLECLWHERLRVTTSTGSREIAVRSTLHNHKPEYPEESGWQYLLNEWIAWIEGGTAPQVALDNSLRSTELYLAAYESAKTGDRIDLPMGRQTEFPLDAVTRRQTSQP